MLRTLWRLVAKPGQLTIDYREGRRNSLLRPLRLVFVVVILTIIFGKGTELLAPEGAMLHFSTMQSDSARKVREKQLERLKNETDLEDSITREAKISGENPEKIAEERRKKIEKLSVPGPDESPSFVARLHKFNEKVSLYSILAMVPLIALILRPLYWNRPFRYGDYLVFSLHYAAASVFAGVLVLPAIFFPNQRILLFTTVIAYFLFKFGYLFLSMQRAYGGRIEHTAARFLVTIIGVGAVQWAFAQLLIALYVRSLAGE